MWEGKKKESCSLKAPVGCSSAPPGAQSDFWPTVLSRGQRGYQKSDPGGNHYGVG